jgi:hypothetical protein
MYLTWYALWKPLPSLSFQGHFHSFRSQWGEVQVNGMHVMHRGKGGSEAKSLGAKGVDFVSEARSRQPPAARSALERNNLISNQSSIFSIWC